MGNMKRGLSTIIGALIFVCIIITCIVPLWVSKQQADLMYDETVAEMRQFDIDRESEDLLLSTSGNTVHLKNMGSISVNVVRAWFNDDPREVNLILPIFGLGELNPDLPDGAYNVMAVTERGRIFTTELNIYKPVKLYVGDTWDDLTPHWFYTDGHSGNATVQNDLPAPDGDHKRAFEIDKTYKGYYGWYWAQSKICGGKIEIDAYLGLHHGYLENDNIRDNVYVIISDAMRFDDPTPPNVPYLILGWTGSAQGWGSGTYNHHIAGTITLGDEPILDFSVAEPNVVIPYRLDLLEGKLIHVFIGYGDSWSADWNQWCSAHKDSWVHLDAEVLEGG